MRLIDADKLHREEIDYFLGYSIQQIENAPTVCDIEQIRNEIEQLTDDKWHIDEYEDGYNTAMKQALDIIDKQIGG